MKLPRGFTLLELIITITILLILMTAAVLQVGSVQKMIRFNNTFSKAVLMVQRARNLAFTKTQGDSNIAVLFEQPNVTLFKDTNGNHGYNPTPTDEKLENPLKVPDGTKMLVQASVVPGNPSLCSNAVIEYENGSGKASFYCDSVKIEQAGASIPQDLELTFRLQDANENRAKCFTVHLLGSVPQPEKCQVLD